jgi:hypothetical protein
MPEWLDAALGVLLVVALGLTPSLLVALLTWKLILHSRPLRLGGSGLLFVVSALSAFGFYGHAGPVPAVVLLLFFETEVRWPTFFFMITAGLVMAGLFFWWSHREHDRVVD